MTHKQTLRRESIWLNIDIRSRNTLQETRFSNIRIPADEQRSCIRINRGQTTEMLAHLVEVEEGIFQSPADCRHSTKGRTLELFALEERLRILEQSHIISGHDLDQVLRSRELTEGYSEMVGIVEGIEEIFVERMDILQAGKSVQDEGELLCECLLREFDFSGIEI
jgi:hypothetical protein